MRVYENGVYRDLTPGEILVREEELATLEREHWGRVTYEEAVNSEIRKRYSASQEFAVLRQQTNKPDEYAAYYAYCEECKQYVKAQMAQYQEVEL